MALGHVPLQQIHSELVAERARQLPQSDFAFSADKLEPSYGDSVDLTIYRCVQESLTNAVRHAQADRVTVELRMAEGDGSSGPQLRLTVRDDGRGIDPAIPPGFGLRGMQERVQGLGGSYKVESAKGRGTSISIAVPIPAAVLDHT
jgi:two-component system sensor histidine kinase UhpB